MRDRPSPNHDARPAGQPVDILLFHYTGMASCEAALARLCDPAAKVSAHYLIEETGTVWRLVPEGRRAWHAGASCWAGARDINARSIGIELCNPGHEFGYRAFPPAQMAALARLAAEVLARHSMPPQRVLGHADVAPARKQDPGELFDWAWLAARGIGLWPELPAVPAPRAALRAGDAGAEVAALRRALAAYGYDIDPGDRFDAGLEAVVTAFQRHWRPARVDGVADAGTRAVLDALLDRVGLAT